jgi:hypothetical protein
VVNARTAIGSRRAFIHHEKRSVRAIVDGTTEHVAFLPIIKDFGVEFREADPTGNHVKTWHGCNTS